LINSFSRVPTLRVIPRSTMFRWKGKAADPEAVGRQLHARLVLLGRVVQRGDLLNVQAELVDVAAEAQVWGEQYNRKLSDFQAVQDDIATQIRERLRVTLSGSSDAAPSVKPTHDATAYRLYLQG